MLQEFLVFARDRRVALFAQLAPRVHFVAQDGGVVCALIGSKRECFFEETDVPGTFEILRDGVRVAARLFKSDTEIIDFIQLQKPGEYLVYKVISSTDSEEWGKVARCQDGSVVRQPFPHEDE